MTLFIYARETNIRRYQTLLETACDETERRTIQGLLAEERANAASPPAVPVKDETRQPWSPRPAL